MAVTAYKFAGTAATADRSSKVAWSSADNAKADDTSYARCDVAKNTYGDWLRLTNFGFATGDIPDGSSIDGIEFVISRYGEQINDLADSDISMRDASGQVGDNEASATKWPTSIGEATYGGAADMLGTTLDDNDIRASTFGIDLSVANADSSAARKAYVDYIKIRVYYTAPVPETDPTVTTQAATAVEATTCTGNGNITDDGTNVDRRGFCYMEGTSGDPDTGDDVAYDDGSFNEGAYTKGITGLTSNTSYRVRAYVTNTASTAYGVTVQIKTLITLTTDWKSPGTAATADRDGKTAWSNPNNAKVDDSNYASQSLIFTYGDWLRLTDFGFDTGDIPDGSTITGIEVAIKRYATGINTSAVYLRDSGGQTGDVSGTQGGWSNSVVQETHGGLTDDWNADLSDSDIRASTFGVDISAVTGSSVTARIYYVAIRVQYTPPPATEFEYSGSVTLTLVVASATEHAQQSFAYAGNVSLAFVVESATEYVNAGFVYAGNVTIQLIPAATVSIEYVYTGSIPLAMGVASATEHVNQEFVYAGAIVLTLTPEAAAAFVFVYAGSVPITLGVASATEYTKSVLQTTDWKGPGTVAQADRSGGAAWVDTENAIVDDSAFAKNVFVLGGTTDWLRLTNFGFDTDDIPEGSIITGIELKVNRDATGSGARTDAIFLRDSSGQVGDSSGTQGDYAGGPEYEYHGGLTDDWNADLLDSDIRASTFGIDLSAYEGSIYLALILYVQIRVQYSAPATSIKTIFGVPIGELKTVNGVAISDLKSYLGISNVG